MCLPRPRPVGYAHRARHAESTPLADRRHRARTGPEGSLASAPRPVATADRAPNGGRQSLTGSGAGVLGCLWRGGCSVPEASHVDAPWSGVDELEELPVLTLASPRATAAGRRDCGRTTRRAACLRGRRWTRRCIAPGAAPSCRPRVHEVGDGGEGVVVCRQGEAHAACAGAPTCASARRCPTCSFNASNTSSVCRAERRLGLGVVLVERLAARPGAGPAGIVVHERAELVEQAAADTEGPARVAHRGEADDAGAVERTARRGRRGSEMAVGVGHVDVVERVVDRAGAAEPQACPSCRAGWPARRARRRSGSRRSR